MNSKKETLAEKKSLGTWSNMHGWTGHANHNIRSGSYAIDGITGDRFETEPGSGVYVPKNCYKADGVGRYLTITFGWVYIVEAVVVQVCSFDNAQLSATIVLRFDQ